jgi:hypothetical protein
MIWILGEIDTHSIYHFICSFILVIMFHQFIPNRHRLFLAIVLTFIIGLGKETLYDGVGEIEDMIFNCLGILSAIVLIKFYKQNGS